MIGILYVGKSRFYLKHGNHSFIFIIVKDKTRTIGMPFVWATDCHSTLFFYHVSNAAITSYEKKRELSEYKAIYMIKDYFFFFSIDTKRHLRAIKGVTSPVQPPTAKREKISSI